MSRAFSHNANSFNVTNNYTIADDKSKILAWLSPLEPRLRHQDIRSQRLEGVGDWVLGTEEFKRLYKGSGTEENDHAILFCYGDPGVGKSHITSLAIDKICDEAMERDNAVACFYFDFAARKQQVPIDMLGSLLKQLVGGLEEIPEAVVREYQKERKVLGGRGLRVSGIVKMVQSLTATRRTFICIDALDECVPEYRVVVLDSLREILKGSSNTRIFLTGRPHIRSEIKRRLGERAASVFIQPIEEDVMRYLRERLRQDTNPEIMDSKLEADIMKSIPETSSETFLLISFHIERLLQETSIGRRRRKLKAMAGGLELGNAYEATLERIRAQGGEKSKLAMATLMWVSHSERPLQVDELCHALAVEIGSTEFDPEDVPQIGTLLGYCQGLITVDKEASTVRLIHFTLQEYLSTHPNLFTGAHSIIAETCLTYLNSQQVKNLTSYPPPEEQNMKFLDYCSRYWGEHAKRKLSDHGRSLALELLNRYEDHISGISLLKQVVHSSHIEAIRAPYNFSGLHCASFFGLVEPATTLINKKPSEINQQDCRSRTPLGWAAMKGHEGVVKLLLDQDDVDPNRPDHADITPLSWAAQEGHEGVMKILLGRQDVDPNRQDIDNRTPLGCAAFEGHEGVVKMLLGRQDVDPNRTDDTDSSPLLLAAYKGHEAVVKVLLGRQDVDPNHQDKNNLTPLGCAAVEGHEGVVKILLGRQDVDPNHQDINDRTPLGCAAVEGHEGVVKILLGRQDVDPNRTDNTGSTPLLLAAYNGHEGVVNILLGREDVDPNHQDENDRTPLGCAAFEGHEGVVKILLGSEDVDPNRTDNTDSTPLLLAAYNGHEGVVKVLLGREDVDPNRTDHKDSTPLLLAAYNGDEGVVKILLGREDVDPNTPDNQASTPLSWAAQNGHEGVVKILLGRADVNPDTPD